MKKICMSLFFILMFIVLCSCSSNNNEKFADETIILSSATSETTEDVKETGSLENITDFEEPAGDSETAEWELLPCDDGFQVVGNLPETLEIPAYVNGNKVTRLYFIPSRYDASKTVKLILPETVEYMETADWSVLEEVVISEDNDFFKAIDGVLFSKDMSVIYLYPVAKKSENYTVPDGVLTIYNDAFYNSKYLIKLTLSDTVSKIMNGAFLCSSVEEIRIGNKVEFIDRRAFGACNDLKQIELPYSLKEIGADCFSECEQLETVIFNAEPIYLGTDIFRECTALNEIVLNYEQVRFCFENGVFVEKNEFGEITRIIRALNNNCPTKYEIPKSSREIDTNAFYGCSALKTVVFPKEVDYTPLSGFTMFDVFEDCENIKNVYVLSDKFGFTSDMFPPDTTIYTFKGFSLAECATDLGYNVVYLDQYTDPIPNTENNNSKIQELIDLTDDLLRYYDICYTRHYATNCYISEDGSYEIYEFGDITTWDELEQFAKNIFTDEGYKTYMYEPYIERNSEYSEYYIQNASGKIGVLKEYDLFIPHSTMFDSSDLNIVSEENGVCIYECSGKFYKGTISDGYLVDRPLIITAKENTNGWKIDRYYETRYDEDE